MTTHAMKHTFQALALLLAAACTAQESTPPEAGSTAGTAAEAADVPAIPSQAEADAAAAQAINQANADAELEKLKNEIGGEK